MKNKEILGIIGVHYPYSLSESFFHDELVELSKHFSKIIVFLTDTHLISKKEILFDVPANVELIELRTKASFISKLRVIFQFKPFVVLKELKTRKPNFSFTEKLKALKTSFYYESRQNVFKASLSEYLEKNSIKPNHIVLYSYWLNEFTLGLVRLKKNLSNYNVYSRAHGWDVYEERHNPPFLPFRKEMISNLDLLFPISEHGKAYLVNNFNLTDDSNLQVSHLGTSSLKINSKKQEEKPLEIVSIAFLSPVKNIELLIESLTELTIPFHWTHIGDDDSEYARAIRKMAIERIPNPNQTVQFLGIKSKEEIQIFLSQAYIDVFINTSISEGIPVSMMEALSAGIPVVGPNVGGISELIREGCGFLLSSKPSASEIKKTFVRVYKMSESERNDMKIAAVNRWEKEFNSICNYANLAVLLKGDKE